MLKEYNKAMWQWFKNIYHLCFAILANVIYGFPARKLTVIGVTGTDGKTTTTNLIYHILKTAGYKVSVISTVSAIIDGEVYDTGFHVTNPASFPLQKFLREAVRKGNTHMVLEVTSHGIDQNRIWGIPFAYGVLTNISHEHLDYHKTYNKYVKTKVRLLNMAKTAIINKDDLSYELVKKYIRSDKDMITYAISNKAAITLDSYSLPANIQPDFNRYNALASLAVCLRMGISYEIVRKALLSFTFPKGRLEVVYKKDFTIMVDFAHTPNSFAQLLPSLKQQAKGRLIHVFGSAGQRDSSKRSLMGKEASDSDDIIILTSEDPRTESPQKIMDQIAKGFDKKKKITVFQIADRKEAIEKAISIAKKGDFIVLTGKAHESSMNYGHGEEPWNEFAVVKEALAQR